MSQDKTEPVIPDDTAPADTARPPSLSESPDDPTSIRLENPVDSPSGKTAAEPADPPELDSAAKPNSEDISNDTETPETSPDTEPTVIDARAPDSLPRESKPFRRILPARSSTAESGAIAFSPRTPWSPLRKRSVIALVAWILLLLGVIGGWVLGRSHFFSIGILLLAIIVAALFPAIDLVRQTRQSIVPVALLPMIAALGAIVIGHWRDAALLLICYATLVVLQIWIVRQSEQPLHALGAARISQATLAGNDHPVSIKEITVGDTIRIGKDEIVPLDGFVETDSTTVDQSIVTGSSEPVAKHRGNDLYAGSRNLGESIDVRVARRPSQRTIARVAKLAKTALPHPSRAQQILEEIANVYALVVLVAAIPAFLVLLVLGDHSWKIALERVVAFLIAASPAALLLTIAVAYRAAMANAIRHGVLFRGQDELEILGTVRTIAFDKTGTLTQGKPAVSGVVNCSTGWTDDEILLRAASAELRSGHRLGGAIVDNARTRGLTVSEPAESIPSPGKGVVATVQNCTVAVGNANLFAELGVNIWRATEISADMRDDGQSAVLVGDRENVRGVIGVSDPLRPEAPDIIATLGTLQIRRTVMLTGDDEVVARVIAAEAGLHEVYADLLPEEKLGVVRQMEQSAPVGMVAGAGENSPTLSLATSGIALGSIAADVTREPAGVLLFGGELAELPFALWIAQSARRTTNAGLVVLIGVMALLATGALVVGIPPLIVILVWFVVTLLVLLTGLRLLHATRRPPRRRLVTHIPVEGDEITPGTMELPKPRYVIDDDEDDDDL